MAPTPSSGVCSTVTDCETIEVCTAMGTGLRDASVSRMVLTQLLTSEWHAYNFTRMIREYTHLLQWRLDIRIVVVMGVIFN